MNDFEIDAHDIINDLFQQLDTKNRELTLSRARERALMKQIEELTKDKEGN